MEGKEKEGREGGMKEGKETTRKSGRLECLKEGRRDMKRRKGGIESGRRGVSVCLPA